jgi:2-oxoglutarate dehydrogenase E2 component (dihydrolipoamide succinyltransferase)
MRVPLDPCGNPIPAAIQQTSGVTPMPSAASRPAAAPATVAPPALSPAAASATKTFSDKPAAAASPATEGWGSSNLQHVDPKQAPASGSVRAEKPATTAGDLKPIETIPTPAAKDAAPVPAAAPAAAKLAPTVAPLNPQPELNTQPQLNLQPQLNAQPQLGPAVEPAPPAASLKDVPASETAGRLLRIVPPVDGHTT